MKIVTYWTNDEQQGAMTHAEWQEAMKQERITRPDQPGFRNIDAPQSWDEWVWQDQPTKEAALARHDQAFNAWREDVDNSRPIKDTY